MNCVYVFGDSHSVYLSKIHAIDNLFPELLDYKFIVKSIPGATIKSFGNRKSTLNTYKIFKEEIIIFT